MAKQNNRMRDMSGIIARIEAVEKATKKATKASEKNAEATQKVAQQNKTASKTFETKNVILEQTRSVLDSLKSSYFGASKAIEKMNKSAKGLVNNLKKQKESIKGMASSFGLKGKASRPKQQDANGRVFQRGEAGSYEGDKLGMFSEQFANSVRQTYMVTRITIGYFRLLGQAIGNTVGQFAEAERRLQILTNTTKGWDDALDKARDIADVHGRSLLKTADTMQRVNQVLSSFTGELGMTQKESLDLTKQFTGLSMAMEYATGKSSEEISNAIGQALTGNLKTLRGLNVRVDEKSLKAFYGGGGDTKNDMFARATAIEQAIKDQNKEGIASYARNITGLYIQLQDFVANIRAIFMGIGQALSPVINPLTNAFNSLFRIVSRGKNSLIGVIQSLTTVLLLQLFSSKFRAMTGGGFSGANVGIPNFLQNLFVGLKTFFTSLGGLKGLSIIGALIAVFKGLYQAVAIFFGEKDAMQTIGKMFSELGRVLGEVFSFFGDLFTAIFLPILDFIDSVVAMFEIEGFSLVESIKSLANGLKEYGDKIIKVFYDIFRWLSKGLLMATAGVKAIFSKGDVVENFSDNFLKSMEKMQESENRDILDELKRIRKASEKTEQNTNPRSGLNIGNINIDASGLTTNQARRVIIDAMYNITNSTKTQLGGA